MRQLSRRFAWSRWPLAMFLFCAGALLAQSTSPAEQAQQARELVAAGKPEQAVPIYEALLNASPENSTLLVNLAVAHFQAGQYTEAVKRCQVALRLQPDLVPAWLFLGASYFQLGEPERAVEPLQRVVAAKPDERNARLMLGESLLRLNRTDEARTHLAFVARLLPKEPRVWYGLERSYRALAREAFAELERRSPDSAYAHAYAGDLRYGQRELGVAFHHYRRALEKQPDLRGVHASLAKLYREAGHPEWAAIEEERERSLPSPDCETERLECAYNAHRLEEVMASPGEPSSLADLYWKLKAYRESARQAGARLAALPPSAQLHEIRAREHEEQGRHGEAAEEWRNALRLSPGDATLRRGLAISLHGAQDFPGALPLLRALLEHAPEDADLQFLTGSCLLNTSRPKEAVPYFERSLQLRPNFPVAQAELGRALLQAGEAAKAIPHLEAGLPVDDDGSRRFQLYRAYQTAGEPDRARDALENYQQFKKRSEAAAREVAEQYEITAPR